MCSGRYGQLSCSTRYSRWGTRLAHRDALSEHLGRRLPPSEYVCHHCDTPACVNIAHLYLGSAKTNAADRVSRGRGVDQKANPPNLNRKFSECTKAKHREKMRRQYAEGWVHPMLGKKHSAESRAKISASLSRRGVTNASDN